MRTALPLDEKRRRANERLRMWRLKPGVRERINFKARTKYATDPAYRAKICLEGRAYRSRVTVEQKKIARDKATQRARKYRLGVTGKNRSLAITFTRKIRALLAVSENLSCSYCGEMDLRVLSVNHKNGDGHSDPHRLAMYVAIIKGARGTGDLEITCFNCNIRYEYQLGRRKFPDEYEAIVAVERGRSRVAA